MKKKVKLSLSFFLLWLLIYPLQAQTVMKSLPIGEIVASEKTLVKDEISLPLVRVNGLLYVLDEHLVCLGLTLEEKSDYFVLKEQEGGKVSVPHTKDEIGKKANSISKPLYWKQRTSHLLRMEHHYYIPVTLFKGIWQNEEKNEQITLKEAKKDYYLSNILIDESGIQNTGDYWMNMQCIHGFWHEKTLETIEEHIILGPGETYAWQQHNGIDAGIQVRTLNGLNVPLEGQTDFYSEANFYEAYADAERLLALEQTFPAFHIMGRMRYAVGTLKEKQEIFLLRAENHAYYCVMDEYEKKHQVPFGSVQILGERGVRLTPITTEMIESFVNLSGIQSETDYLLWTDVYRQRTYVLKKQNNQWKHLHTFICSTGKNKNPTPTGLYKVQYAIPYFGLGKGYRCKYALVFFRDYMYHSILFDKTGQYIKAGQYELGYKASHGCVRLSEKDSLWLYDHIPVKTTVWIR